MRLNRIKQAGTRCRVFLNSNYPLLNGIKQIMYFGDYIRNHHVKIRIYGEFDGY